MSLYPPFTPRWRHHSVETKETYGSWANMRYRCFDVAHPYYPSYGGRGITICNRWADDYDAFYEDMGPRPVGTTLDRIDNDGNYTLENCRWATGIEQSRNTSKNRNIVWNGQTKCVAEWAEILGLHKSALEQRLNKYPVEKAMTSKWFKRVVPVHGTIYMYTRKRCRCEKCRQCNRDYQKEWKLRNTSEYDL